MSKEIVVNAGEKETRIAIVENGKIAELYIENPDHERTIGNIYLGRVRKVMPSIQAAFVDIGQEQDAFLHFSDLSDNFADLLKLLDSDPPRVGKTVHPSGNGSSQKPSKLLKRGQQLLVQITKEPISNKGSRITTGLTMAGRFLVLMPMADHVAVSRKITSDKERRRLEALAESLVPDGFGAIVRTVAEGRDAKSLDTDLKLLVERWRRAEKRLAEKPSAPALIHEDVDMASSIIRDQFSSDYERILIDDEDLYHSVRSYVRAVAPKMASAVELHDGPEPAFEAAGIQHGADRAFRDRIELPSGGYLYIEKTEAMHVIDVNSGRSGKGMSQEENSLKVNLEAARVISHQVRLRDLGGIIVIDFIDLRSDKNRQKVYEEIEKGFDDDRAVTKILPMSEFGLVEITRQRLRPSITSTFSASNGSSGRQKDTQSSAASKGGNGEAQQIQAKANRQAKKLTERIEKYKKEVRRLENEVERWKERAEQPSDEVRELRDEVRRLRNELDAASESAPPPEATEEAHAPQEVVDAIESWIEEYASKGRRRPVTLRVHPFTAAFLHQPVPSYVTRWFMDHMVRVHIETDTSLSPLAFRFENARSGEAIDQRSLAAMGSG